MTTTQIGPVRAVSNRFSASTQLVTFLLGAEEYAIPVSRVREIIRPCPTTAIPHSPPHVKGLVNLRNLVVPVIDLRIRLGLEETPVTHRSRIVVIQLEDRTLGAIVDSVTGVVRFSEEEVRSLPATEETDVDYVRGIVEKDEAFVILLEVERLFGGSDSADRA